MLSWVEWDTFTDFFSQMDDDEEGWVHCVMSTLPKKFEILNTWPLFYFVETEEKKGQAYGGKREAKEKHASGSSYLTAKQTWPVKADKKGKHGMKWIKINLILLTVYK